MMTTRRDGIRFWFLLIALLIGGGLVNVWDRAGETKVSRRPLKEFPSQLGSWRQMGEDLRFDSETEKVFRADDYLSRNFESGGRVTSFYAGFYTRQRTGSTNYSPLNFFLGSGG